MKLDGSCNCGRVRYTCEADGPVPFMRCYCEYCRKTGGGGYMVNLLAKSDTLVVEGREFVKVHRASKTSQHERHFCGECGSHLWAYNPRWPHLVHPVASSVDTPLPEPPSTTHMFVDSKPSWLHLNTRPEDRVFATYPDESLEAWHRRHGLYQD